MTKTKQATRKRRANGANGRRRANNTGTLEKRGNKWLARWYVYDAQGKRIRKSEIIDAANIADARDALRKRTEGNALISREKEIRRNLDELDGVAAGLREWRNGLPALSLKDGFTAYRQCATRSDSGERTMEGYESQYNAFVSWMAEHRPECIELRQVTAADANAYSIHLAERWTGNTHNKHITFLKCLWRTLAEADDGKAEDESMPEKRRANIAINPFDRIRLKNHIAHSRRELTIEELYKICDAAEGEMRLMIAVGIYTGLRMGDCATITWGNIDLVKRLITIAPRKTKRRTHAKPVVVPIHPSLWNMLAETPPGKRSGYLIPETAEMYLRDSSRITYRFNKLLAGCGIKYATENETTGRIQTDVGFHSLRHTFVSLSANAGTPLAVVQAIVGHTNQAMTRHYFHEQQNALVSAVAALPDITHADADGNADGVKSESGGLKRLRGLLDKLDLAALQDVARYAKKRIEDLQG